MAKRRIVLTEEDSARLVELVTELRVSRDADMQGRLDMLEAELNRAVTVKPQDVPGDVVTMNSCVQFHEIASGEAMTCTITYPRDADIAGNKVSVLAPIGMALIGYRVGDIVTWRVPAGKRRFHIDRILFQPEAAGLFSQ